MLKIVDTISNGACYSYTWRIRSIHVPSPIELFKGKSSMVEFCRRKASSSESKLFKGKSSTLRKFMETESKLLTQSHISVKKLCTLCDLTCQSSDVKNSNCIVGM